MGLTRYPYTGCQRDAGQGTRPHLVVCLLPVAGVYERLMLAGSSEKELEIVRDLSRTYPSHVYYQQRQGPGQRSLFNVLRAYSVYDRQVRISPCIPQYLCAAIPSV